MNFLEFKRELDRRVADPNVRYMLATVFEAQLECIAQVDQMARVLVNVVDQVQKVVNLNAASAETLEKMKRGWRPEGVDVVSESITDDPEDHH